MYNWCTNKNENQKITTKILLPFLRFMLFSNKFCSLTNYESFLCFKFKFISANITLKKKNLTYLSLLWNVPNKFVFKHYCPFLIH